MRERESRPRLLRFYGYKDRRGVWFGICLDLNIGAEADSPEELKHKLNEMVDSYIKTVLELNDDVSIRQLLNRRAPWRYWICYYLLCCPEVFSKILPQVTFTESHLLPAYGDC